MWSQCKGGQTSNPARPVTNKRTHIQVYTHTHTQVRSKMVQNGTKTVTMMTKGVRSNRRITIITFIDKKIDIVLVFNVDISKTIFYFSFLGNWDLKYDFLYMSSYDECITNRTRYACIFYAYTCLNTHINTRTFDGFIQNQGIG